MQKYDLIKKLLSYSKNFPQTVQKKVQDLLPYLGQVAVSIAN